MTIQAHTDPFALLMNPETVLSAMSRSKALQGVKRRVCRPLDKPWIPLTRDAQVAKFDQEIDALTDLDD